MLYNVFLLDFSLFLKEIKFSLLPVAESYAMTYDLSFSISCLNVKSNIKSVWPKINKTVQYDLIIFNVTGKMVVKFISKLFTFHFIDLIKQKVLEKVKTKFKLSSVYLNKIFVK